MDWERSIEEWTAYGLCCRIKPGMVSLNGYVQIPPDLFTAEAAKRVLAVHFGITYGPDADGWVGFDTGHAGDSWAPDDLIGRIDDQMLQTANELRLMAGRMSWGRQWTMSGLRQETENLAQQVAIALDLSTVQLTDDTAPDDAVADTSPKPPQP